MEISLDQALKGKENNDLLKINKQTNSQGTEYKCENRWIILAGGE